MTKPPPDDRCLSHTKNRSKNRQSLQLPGRPLDVPIPPSLLQSHYLNSPDSIFQRSVSASRVPSEEDEQWLQDTVPLHLSSQDNDRMRGRLPTQSAAPSSNPSSGETSADSRQSHSSSSQNASVRSSSHCAPPSPPLARWRHPSHPAPPAWTSDGQPRVRSAPCMAGREYFVRP